MNYRKFENSLYQTYLNNLNTLDLNRKSPHITAYLNTLKAHNKALKLSVFYNENCRNYNAKSRPKSQGAYTTNLNLSLHIYQNIPQPKKDNLSLTKMARTRSSCYNQANLTVNGTQFRPTQKESTTKQKISLNLLVHTQKFNQDNNIQSRVMIPKIVQPIQIMEEPVLNLPLKRKTNHIPRSLWQQTRMERLSQVGFQHTNADEGLPQAVQTSSGIFNE
ncbi:hypothetical protein SS50377_26036 [Spironucleus salmonicida]|uniref:Uncharacterized protein n=1 Tax=Spironucleus salmonicida TaxID=348837 RepID=V6LDM0_9EUKA|nr:hypothetical protein SS50377_26036 [Spironucleus salmonicida]|eukprot:EST42343.1 Hypothetical protein SS50377_18132 [Spironucleus salmonicida]